jgi:hypothetical protein
MKTLALLLALTLWYSLTFIGVSGLVSPWHVSDGVWFYLAAALGIGLLVGAYALWKRYSWGDWQLLFLLAMWLSLQFQSHWRPFFFPPSAEQVQGYYANFPFWYLLPKSEVRVVPDGYHTIMHLLMMLLFVNFLIRVTRQVRCKA